MLICFICKTYMCVYIFLYTNISTHILIYLHLVIHIYTKEKSKDYRIILIWNESY